MSATTVERYAIEACRNRCWSYDWVIDLVSIRGAAVAGIVNMLPA